MSKYRKITTLLFVIGIMIGLTACTTIQVDPGENGWSLSELETAAAGNDPIEPFNRTMFVITDFSMNYIIAPLGRIYTTILPRPVIEKFDNLCVNLEYPDRLFSSLLMAEWRGAGDETLRFLINTTLGIAGLRKFGVKSVYWSASSSSGTSISPAIAMRASVLRDSRAPSLKSSHSMMRGSDAAYIASALAGWSCMTPSVLIGTFVSPLKRAARDLI